MPILRSQRSPVGRASTHSATSMIKCRSLATVRVIGRRREARGLNVCNWTLPGARSGDDRGGDETGVDGLVLGADADCRRRMGGLDGSGVASTTALGAAGASDMDAAPACSAAVNSETDCLLGWPTVGTAMREKASRALANEVGMDDLRRKILSDGGGGSGVSAHHQTRTASARTDLDNTARHRPRTRPRPSAADPRRAARRAARSSLADSMVRAPRSEPTRPPHTPDSRPAATATTSSTRPPRATTATTPRADSARPIRSPPPRPPRTASSCDPCRPQGPPIAMPRLDRRSACAARRPSSARSSRRPKKRIRARSAEARARVSRMTCVARTRIGRRGWAASRARGTSAVNARPWALDRPRGPDAVLDASAPQRREHADTAKGGQADAYRGSRSEPI